MSQTQPKSDDIAENENALDAETALGDRSMEHAERSILIILGLTVSVLAGFLSQVWSSAGVAFRTELAEYLFMFGTLFTGSFSLPVMRFHWQRLMLLQKSRSVTVAMIWMAAVMIVFFVYVYLLNKLGETIVKHAKIPI